MTTQEKLVQKKLTLLELGEYLQNVSEACRISGCSRQHFYDIKKAYESQGLEGLKEKTRRKPCVKNRVAPEIEQAVLQMAFENPAYGQLRASNELRKQGVLISSGGIRSIWLRHGLETFKKRLKALEEKAAKEGIVYTEEQLRVLEQARKERETVPDEIETHHPGYLLAQDTFYVGYLKGVGRIYQQTVIDTYSSVAFAKLYTAKVPLTAADTLNDRVLPFFEEQGVDILRILTDRGTEYCGRLDKHPFWMSFTRRLSGRESSVPSKSCRRSWITGWIDTTGSELTKGNGVKARHQWRLLLTGWIWHERQTWKVNKWKK
jgi:hypothetical protein